MKMLLQHVQTPPVPPSQRTELPIPRELDELVLACLEKDPEQAARRTPSELFADGLRVHAQCDALEQRPRPRPGGKRTCRS